MDCTTGEEEVPRPPGASAQCRMRSGSRCPRCPPAALQHVALRHWHLDATAPPPGGALLRGYSEARDRVGLRLVAVEDRQQPREHEKVLNAALRIRELYRRRVSRRGRVTRDQLAQTATIDISHVLKVENDVLATSEDQPCDRILDAAGMVQQGHLAVQIQDGHRPYASLCQLHLSNPPSSYRNWTEG